MLAKLLMDALQMGSSSKDDDPTSLMDLVRTWRTLRDTVDSQAGLYAQLIQLELEQEKARLTRIAILASVAVFCLGGCMLFLGILLLALVWDHDYRNWFIGAIVVGYALVALIAAWRIKTVKRTYGRPFASVREELAADIASIKSQL